MISYIFQLLLSTPLPEDILSDFEGIPMRLLTADAKLKKYSELVEVIA